jgi:diguanylate cyclase (GGDEF)-like protein
MRDDRLDDEEARIAALRRYEIVEGGQDDAFDRIASVVQLSLDAPIAAVAFVDRNRQVFKPIRGFDVDQAPREIAFCTHTIQGRVPLNISDALADRRFAEDPSVLGSPHIRSYLGVPLTTPDNYNVGALCAIDTMPRRFDTTHTLILENLARVVIEHLELRQMAKSDGLTGALTRRGFLSEVERDFERSRRYDRPSALVLIDIDHFKRINDLYGHQAGDDVLMNFARSCRDGMRRTDVLGRMGGEEFGLLLPETDASEALECAERLRTMIEAMRVKSDGQEIAVTASFGVAALGPGITGAAHWLSEADIALYEAKQFGRNRAVAARRLGRGPVDVDPAVVGTDRLLN